MRPDDDQIGSRFPRHPENLVINTRAVSYEEHRVQVVGVDLAHPRRKLTFQVGYEQLVPQRRDLGAHDCLDLAQYGQDGKLGAKFTRMLGSGEERLAPADLIVQVDRNPILSSLGAHRD